MVILPLLYWCIDAQLGLRIGAMLLLSNGLNFCLKLAFHSPRPYWYDPKVIGYASETSFGLPSGHAQIAACVWGLFGASFKSRWLKIFVVLIIFLIGLSRIFLGVHFTSDVLVGWLIGILLLVAFLAWEKPLAAWFLRRRPLLQVIIAFVSSLSVILISLLIVVLLKNWQIPVDWIANAVRSTNTAPDPLNLENAFTAGGTWFGLLAGIIWFHVRYGTFNTSGLFTQKLLRYLLGIAGIVILWYGLGSILPRSSDWLGFSLRYLRYTLIGFWVSFLGPLVFIKTHLASENKV